MALDWFRLVPLIFGSASIIVGSALTWHIIRTASQVADHSIRSKVSYESISFVFAAVTGWLFWFFGNKNNQGKDALAALFYGLFFYVHIFGVQSWSDIDDGRYAQKNSLNYILSSLGQQEIEFSSGSSVKKYLAGSILNFFGIYLVLFVVHGKFSFKFNIATILFLVAIALDVVGIIILWNLHAVAHTTSSGNVSYNDQNVRSYVFQFVTVPQTAILVILAGSIWHERPDGAFVASALSGIWGVWYLAYGFAIKSGLNNDSESTHQVEKSWAGSLFCWFSAWTTILAAFFAVAGHAGANNGKVSPV